MPQAGLGSYQVPHTACSSPAVTPARARPCCGNRHGTCHVWPPVSAHVQSGPLSFRAGRATAHPLEPHTLIHAWHKKCAMDCPVSQLSHVLLLFPQGSSKLLCKEVENEWHLVRVLMPTPTALSLALSLLPVPLLGASGSSRVSSRSFGCW